MPGVPSGKGCAACRKAKKKCDESQPVCARCLRLRFECVGSGQKRFAFRQVEPNASKACPSCKTAPGQHSNEKSECTCGQQKAECLEVTSRKPRSFRDLPNTANLHLSPTFLVRPTYCTLSSQEVQYFDRFRHQVVYQMGSDDAFEKFWFHTVLRESARSKGILDIVMGIGALAQALEGAPRDMPLYKASLSSYSTSNHFAAAVKYYTRSLVKLRQELSTELEASSRSLLISTILFSAFELLQGNVNSSDTHMSSGVLILKDLVMRSAWPGKKSLLATSCDDEGVEQAEFILMWRPASKCLLFPSYSQVRRVLSTCNIPYTKGPKPPPHKNTFEVFLKRWLKFCTLVLLWYVRYELPAEPEHSTSVRQRLYEERDDLLSQLGTWEVAMQARSEDGSDPYGAQLSRQILPGLKTLRFFIITVFNDTIDSEDESKKIAREINSWVDALYDADPLFDSARGEIYGGVLSISMCLARRCRDQEVRFKAMSLCKRVVNAQSRWDGKEILMGTSALIEIEEAGRDETGCIPMAARYDWISSSWNDSYTRLTVAFSSKVTIMGVREERTMTLRPEDYGLV